MSIHHIRESGKGTKAPLSPIEPFTLLLLFLEWISIILYNHTFAWFSHICSPAVSLPGISPGRLDLAHVWAWMIKHLSYLGPRGSRGGTCLCWPMERRQHWGWLMGTKRVRADLDPRLLPWTAVVSTDYLNGFWFVNKINALWITLNPFPCCLDWVSGHLGLSGATWLASLPIIRVLLRSYFPLETKWLHPRVAAEIMEKQKGPCWVLWWGQR